MSLERICWCFANFVVAVHYLKSVQIRSFFCSVFSCIRTEHGDLLPKSLYAVRIQENLTRKNSVFGQFHAVIISVPWWEKLVGVTQQLFYTNFVKRCFWNKIFTLNKKMNFSIKDFLIFRAVSIFGEYFLIDIENAYTLLINEWTNKILDWLKEWRNEWMNEPIDQSFSL